MRTGRLFASTLAFGLSASILIIAACGDTEDTVECDAAVDTGNDVKSDTKIDVDTPDAKDGSTTDTTVADALPDTRFVTVDGASFPDTSNIDGGVKFDAGPADPVKFTEQVTGEYCARFGNCCLVGGFISAYDNAQCVNDLETNGFPYGLFGIPTVYKAKLAAGNLAFDSSAGEVCLGLIRTYSCTAFGSPDWIELNRQCLSAMKGKIAVNGTGCTSAVECVQPAYCDMSGGGPTGTCKPYLQSAAPCTDSTQCGDGLTGIPRYCSNITSGTPSGTCIDQLPAGAECGGFPQQCATQLCEPDSGSSTGFRCATQASFASAVLCTPYAQ